MFNSIDEIYIAGCLCISISLLCFVLSLQTKNHSHVDRAWSITPPLYILIASSTSISSFLNSTPYHPQLLAMFLLTLAWGVRLSFNFYRKGGYNLKEEDYRWAVIKKWKIFESELNWQLFNFFFISCYQNCLLLLLTYSAFCIAKGPIQPWSQRDSILCITALIILFIETIADQQQWNYYTERSTYRSDSTKKSPPNNPRIWTQDPDDLKNGFFTKGLFKFSRHPNWFCEICFWWVIWGFRPTLMAGLGAGLLTLLFQGSVWITEKITLSKYPSYLQYQKTTSKLIPFFPNGWNPKNE